MKAVIVSGPPCAGKSTYVAEHRNPQDVVIDLDAIAQAFGYPHEHLEWPADHHPARTIAHRARTSAIKALRGLTGGFTVWIISTVTTAPPTGIGPAELVVLDPGRDVCRERAHARNDGDELHLLSTLDQIDLWYAGHESASRDW